VKLRGPGKTGRTVLFCVAQLVVVLLLLEGALRIVRPMSTGLNALLYLPSIATDYDSVDKLEALLAGTVLGYSPCREDRGFVLNSRSFRTREYPDEPDPDQYRVMTLGDSFTYASGGLPYRQMWSAELERRLDAAFSDEVRVFSLGIPGVGPRFQLRLWELEHPLLDPDLVVVAFFIGNDFTDERRQQLTPARSGRAIELSYTLRLVRNLGRVWAQRATGESWRPTESVDLRSGECGRELDPERRAIEPPRFSESDYLGLEGARMQICNRGRRPEFLEAAVDTVTVFERFSSEIRATGSDLVVMMIPDEFQVDESLRVRVLAHLGNSADDYDIDLPQLRLAEALAGIGVRTVDLLPRFRSATEDRRLYWPLNTHWNAGGHALAAEILAEHITRWSEDGEI
jgi:hypothetical protein